MKSKREKKNRIGWLTAGLLCGLLLAVGVKPVPAKAAWMAGSARSTVHIEVSGKADMGLAAQEPALNAAAEEIVFDKVIANVQESLNVRAEASTSAEIVGKLYRDSYAVILERGTEWTKIQSGDVIGYASNQYLHFDEKAIAKAQELGAFRATVTAGTVNVRTAPSLSGTVLTEAHKGDTFVQLPEATTDEWTAVQLEDGTTAYLSAQFTECSFELETAVSMEEIEAKKKAEELAKALEAAKHVEVADTNREAITMSDEDIFLMAIVITMEAGSESYEGQLAVANVLINRLLSGIWGDTLSDVVYAPNQFSGANSGRIEKFSAKVTESCKRAAVEALAGNNNIGDFMNFIMKDRANLSSYSEYYILGNHCFYKR
ncbi:MAG: cell wall hydrolase [Lachnospiraceae bacterium]|nr:cell wall hydrolase [Lachnospiraceae bacterium]